LSRVTLQRLFCRISKGSVSEVRTLTFSLSASNNRFVKTSSTSQISESNHWGHGEHGEILFF
jgi:hypothetical protein